MKKSVENFSQPAKTHRLVFKLVTLNVFFVSECVLFYCSLLSLSFSPLHSLFKFAVPLNLFCVLLYFFPCHHSGTMTLLALSIVLTRAKYINTKSLIQSGRYSYMMAFLNIEVVGAQTLNLFLCK